jgi:hypothetical protein
MSSQKTLGKVKLIEKKNSYYIDHVLRARKES